MAQLLLADIDPETVQRLELRAKRLGTTVQAEAVRLLRERLEAEAGQPANVQPLCQEQEDPRFVEDHGFLVFVGDVAPEAIPDHRALREEHVDSLLNGTDARRL
jgi:plasmid stability protein